MGDAEALGPLAQMGFILFCLVEIVSPEHEDCVATQGGQRPGECIEYRVMSIASFTGSD